MINMLLGFFIVLPNMESVDAVSSSNAPNIMPFMGEWEVEKAQILVRDISLLGSFEFGFSQEYPIIDCLW